jgi:hypothetical protein
VKDGRALISKVYDLVEFSLWVFRSLFIGYFLFLFSPLYRPRWRERRWNGRENWRLTQTVTVQK